MTTQNITVSLTSAMAQEISSSGILAYAVYFDPNNKVSGVPQPVWTPLSGSTSGGTTATVTMPNPISGAKLYFLIQDTNAPYTYTSGVSSGATVSVTPSVSSIITGESQVGFSGNAGTNAVGLNYRF